MPKLNSLTAAATPAAYQGITRVGGNLVFHTSKETRTERKQKRAWKAYDNIGEIHFLASGLIGSAIETLAWYGAVDDAATTYTYAPAVEDEASPLSEKDAATVRKIVEDIKPSWGQQQDFFRALAVNLLIAGEMYVFTRQTDDPASYTHELVPKDNITRNERAGNNKVVQEFKDPVTEQKVVVGNRGKLDRIYRPHPGRLGEADSPIFAILDLLDELNWIQRVIDNVFRKRLTSAGVLVMTNAMLGPDYNPNTQSAIAGQNNKVEAAIIRQMTANIDPETDSPALPIILFAPPDQVKDGFNLIEMDNELPKLIIEERKEVIRRIANSLDVPAEFLLGIGTTTHWSAWLVRDLLWQQHLQPLATLIANSLTVTFVRPALRRLKALGQFDGDPDAVKLWYQTATLQSHPDLFEFLVQAHDLGVVGKDPILRALGIPPEAAITDEEFELWLELKRNPTGQPVEEGEVEGDGTTKEPAPSRQPTGSRRRPRSGPADRRRSGEDGPSQR